ncbi:hypothetical protein CISIN_1g0371362mg, partial [Citrus sinensis]
MVSGLLAVACCLLPSAFGLLVLDDSAILLSESADMNCKHRQSCWTPPGNGSPVKSKHQQQMYN